MLQRNFTSLLKAKWDQKKFVCVGLDSDTTKIPKSAQQDSVGQTLLEFNKAIVDATHDLVCSYKLQIAYYEAHGPEGIEAMIKTNEYIKSVDTTIPLIVDAKRADIGSTNEAYIKALFEIDGFDAVTLNPYPGQEALQPFLDLKDKGLIIWCRASNPGAGEFQDLEVEPGVPLWQYVAKRVATKWNQNNNCLLVIGATYPEEMKIARQLVGDMPFLIPGIGAQGGDIEQTVKAGQDSHGQGMIISSSRGIIFASNGPDFAELARQETKKLHEEINSYL